MGVWFPSVLSWGDVKFVEKERVGGGEQVVEKDRSIACSWSIRVNLGIFARVRKCERVQGRSAACIGFPPTAFGCGTPVVFKFIPWCSGRNRFFWEGK